MERMEYFKACLLDVLAAPTENRVIVETRIPLLDGDVCNVNLYYMIDLSDGSSEVYDKFHVSASNGKGRSMELHEVLDFFERFILSDIVERFYVEGF